MKRVTEPHFLGIVLGKEISYLYVLLIRVCNDFLSVAYTSKSWLMNFISD